MSNLLMLIGSIMAERFAYLPSVGLAACAVAAIYALAGLRGASMAPCTAVVAVLCVACAARTYARNFDWENDRSLWTSAVEAVPESAKAHYNLGTLLSDVPGERAQAIWELEAALRINPDRADAHDNLGRLLIEDPARQSDAIAQWEAAVRIDPRDGGRAQALGGGARRNAGTVAGAIAEFQVAARLQPDVAETHANLGTVLFQAGQFADADGRISSGDSDRSQPRGAAQHFGNRAGADGTHRGCDPGVRGGAPHRPCECSSQRESAQGAGGGALVR